eukprot:6930720-Alexandrium_andersonii.AAC.1
MSASLVGSEMCIRDRVHRAARMPAIMEGCMPICFNMLGSMPMCMIMQGSVSYTHLTLPTICSV